MITGVAKVVVPVDDQERAKQFWTGAIGFDVVMDEVYGDERWIEVEAPDRSVVLVLSRRTSDEPRRQVPDALPHSNVFLTCEDIEQTYAELTARGVRFPRAAPRKCISACGRCSRTGRGRGSRSDSGDRGQHERRHGHDDPASLPTQAPAKVLSSLRRPDPP